MMAKKRLLISSGTSFEPVYGYSRAVRVGNTVHVAGTTAIDEGGKVVGEGDVYAQLVFAIQKIERALHAAGATLEDVVRTRTFVTDITQWRDVARAHGQFFTDIRPAATLVEVRALISPELLVEIEVDAVVDDAVDGTNE